VGVYRDETWAALEQARALRDENDDLRRALVAVQAEFAKREGAGVLPSVRSRCTRVGVALVAGVVVVSSAIEWVTSPLLIECPISTARTSALELRRAAETWRSTHGDDCPTPEVLRLDQAIDTASKLEDPWGGSYVIQCDPDETYVHSAGSDRRFYTPDDIVVPEILVAD
jgi:hypothetical protein